jgi:hypothetical protein
MIFLTQKVYFSWLSMHYYIPLVISRNDKNKRLTLLSQHKLALTGGIHFLEHLKNKKMALSSIYHTCHQKQNPSRETVHLIRHVDLVWCTCSTTGKPTRSFATERESLDSV